MTTELDPPAPGGGRLAPEQSRILANSGRAVNPDPVDELEPDNAPDVHVPSGGAEGRAPDAGPKDQDADARADRPSSSSEKGDPDPVSEPTD